MLRVDRMVNNIFSLGGKVGPKAEDVAYIASDPGMEREILKGNLARLGLSFATPILQALGTWGIFHIGDTELPKWSGETAYLASRVGGGAALGVLGKVNSLANYDHVYTPFRNKFLDIPPEIRSKLNEYLVEGGIPKNLIGEHLVPRAIYDMGGLGYVPELFSALATPILQIVAAGSAVPWEIKAGLLAFSYSGLVVGPKLNKQATAREFEWNVVSGALSDSRETSGAGGEVRNTVAKKWWSDVLGKYLKSYGAESGRRGLVDLAAGLAPFFRGADLFGWVSMIQGVGLGGFVKTMDVIGQIKDKQIQGRVVALAREFCENGVFLPVEQSWDNFRKDQLASGNMVHDLNLSENVVCEFVNFVPEIGEDGPPEICGILSRGKCHMLDGRSGDGKSLFLYALRGLAKSRGNVVFRDRVGNAKSIYEFSQADLSEKIMYFTPERRGDGRRVVDEYADAFIDANKKEFDSLPVAIQRALIVPDALIERRIRDIKSAGEVIENEWESELLNELSGEEVELVSSLRTRRLEFTEKRLKYLGVNLDNIKADRKLAEVSSGMRERILLDGSTLYFLDRGPSVMVLDEAFRMVDSKTATELMGEICRRMLEIEVNKRPALVFVTNVHKDELREVVKKTLGEEGLIQMSVARGDD